MTILKTSKVKVKGAFGKVATGPRVLEGIFVKINGRQYNINDLARNEYVSFLMHMSAFVNRYTQLAAMDAANKTKPMAVVPDSEPQPV